MGGGNESVFDEQKEESSSQSSMEKDEVPCREEDEKEQSLLMDWGALSSPPAQDLSAESSAESSVTIGKSRMQASTLLSSASPTASSRTQRKMSRKKSAKNVGARSKLLAYRPGSFLGRKADNFKIPEVASLLVVGMRGAGKSAVINRIIRVMDAETAKFYRAPLAGSHEQSGTYFLSEYSICKGNVSLFDTRGFTESEVAERMSVAEEWMTQGVRDGQRELRPGDARFLQEDVKLRGRHVDHMLSKRRDVNFVIFVVNAAKFMDKKKHGESKELEKMKILYENPFFSFRDDRPVLLMTHTDELTDADRVQAPFALAEHFKISSIEEIYDISGTTDDSVGDDESTPASDNVLEMLATALQRADRHFPMKRSFLQAVVDLYDNCLNHVRNTDTLKFYWKIIALYVVLVGFIYFCVILGRTHRSLMQWMDHSEDGGSNVTITLPWLTVSLPWLGKKLRL